MLDKDGNRFLCYLPKEEKATSGWTSSQQNISTVTMETQKQVKLKTPDELLQPLSEKCLLRVSFLKWFLLTLFNKFLKLILPWI